MPIQQNLIQIHHIQLLICYLNKNIEDLGGTLRLGLYPCTIKDHTLAHDIYNETNIEERHRHRYEFNNTYREQLEDKGMVFSGTSPDGRLVEMVEIPENDFFIACQFHPEFLSDLIDHNPFSKLL